MVRRLYQLLQTSEHLFSLTTNNPSCSRTVLSPSIFTGCSRICRGFPLAVLRRWLVAVVCYLFWGTRGSTSLAFPPASARCRDQAHPSLQLIKSDDALWQKVP